MLNTEYQQSITAPLGVFDSGYGGLTVLRAIHERLPELSTFYLGDNARAPYGTRSEEEIFRFTLKGLRFLFAAGSPLVIIACNTSSAGALRRIQQTVLPREFPDRRVLGVIRPYAEAAAASATGHIGVIGTTATIESGAYSRELEKACPGARVTEIAVPRLAGLIEAGEEESREAETECSKVLAELLRRDSAIDSVLLACTHFPLAQAVFDRHRPTGVSFLPQAPIVADKLANYLGRHQEINGRLEKAGRRLYATTADANKVSKLATKFYGQPLEFEQAVIC